MKRLMMAVVLVSSMCVVAAELPRVLSHRGGRHEYDDNAAGGFQKCLDAGLTGFETDFRMTKDLKLVVMHDAKVERTTEGKGVVEEMSFDEVTSLVMKRSREKAPSAQQVMDVFKGRADVDIELEMKASGKFYEGENLETYCRQNGIKSWTGKFLSTTQLHQIFSSPFCCPATPEIYDYYAEKGCIMDEGSPRDMWDGSHGVMIYGRTTEKRVNRKKKHIQAPPDQWRVSIGYHEPTLDAETWLRIQGHFGRKKFDKKMKHETTLLKGVLRCKCGRLMSLARKKRVDGSVVTWYHCPKRERAGVEACDSKAIKAELLDEKVLEIFREIEHDPEAVRKYVQEEKKTADSGDQIRKKIHETEKKIGKLTSALATSEKSAAAKYIIAEIEELDAELVKLKRKEAEASLEKRRNAAMLKSAQEKREEVVRLLANFDDFTMDEKNEIARSVIREAVWDNETLFIVL